MVLTRLPVELNAAILAHLPSSSLLAVALTCRTLCASAQRSLFNTIHVAQVHGNLAVISTLARKPCLAALVQDFSFALSPETDEFMEQHGWDDPQQALDTSPLAGLFTLLSVALQHMSSSLITLSLLLSPAASRVLQLAPRSAFPVLQTFTCAFALDGDLSSFLAKAPELRTLALDSPQIQWRSEEDLDVIEGATNTVRRHTGLVPRLEELTCAPATAAMLVPGRPVRVLHVLAAMPEDVVVPTTENDEALALLPALGSSTAVHGIEHLTIATGAPVLPFLQQLREHVPHVFQLRVGTTYRFGDGWDAEFYDRVGEALAALPCLRAFELSGMSWPCSSASPSTDVDVDGDKPLSWRPANLPLSPPGHVNLAATGVAEDAAAPSPVDDGYDFFDYLA